MSISFVTREVNACQLSLWEFRSGKASDASDHQNFSKHAKDKSFSMRSVVFRSIR